MIIGKSDIKMQWNMKNNVMITIKHLQMNPLLAMVSPLGIDMPLGK